MISRILTIVSLLVGINLYAQESTEPFKKANTIILHTENSDSVNYLQFARHLLKHDYSINNRDIELMTIDTDLHGLKTRPGWAYGYLFRIQFINQTIIIKPYLKNTISGVMNVRDPVRWKWAKAKANVQNMIWKETLDMLHDYCECKINYRKQ